MTYRKDREKAPPIAEAKNLDYVNLIDTYVEGNNNNTIAMPTKNKRRKQGGAGRGLPALQPTSQATGKTRMSSRDQASQVIAQQIKQKMLPSLPQEQHQSLKRKRDEWGDFEAFGNSDDDNDQDPRRAQGKSQKENKHPWMRHDYSQQSTAIEMFTQEIRDFADYLKPTPEEHAIRTYVFKAVEEFVTGLWSEAKVHAFGSFNTRLYLPGR